ncbi:hypothetical protein JCGZ_15366 [Jatropha curcas]|uniref:Aminotransferase-like plant mobile domain-containing protein n=1 Tax=Jatropha curcas TaxID=180498 RepID=A0A067KI68_JATCU|nr:hypothetical protein JCGZ_15366 [Jatropha curcas]
MTSSGHSSDEDFLESLGISLDTDLTADANTHASVTGIYAQTWAFEYFPYTRPELIHADLGLGLVPLAWRWYRSNLHTIRHKKSMRDLRTFFDTCTLEQRVDLQIRGCRSVPYPPPEAMRAGKQMTLTDAHTEGVPHVEFIMGGDYAEFCRVFLMQPIGSRLDSIQRSAPSQPLDTNSSRASGPSTRTLRRRPTTYPSSSTPVEGPSRARPSRSTGPSRAPRALIDATRPLHPDLANLHLSYNISYRTPDGTLAFREVSLANVNRWNLPSDSINEVPDGLVSQMMELILGWSRSFLRPGL